MAAATATSLPETETEHAEEASPGRGRKLLLVLGVVLLVAAAAWWLFLRGGGEDEPTEPEEGLVVEVAQMTVNLAGDDFHYVRFAFALVLTDGTAPAEVEARFPLLKDAALSVAQSFTETELRTPEGTDRLRAELTRRAHDVYPEGLVLRAVLTEMLVQ